jgi:uncharacterized protein
MIEYIGKTLLIEEGREKILVIGDLHLGYEMGLNKSGISVGGKMYEEMIVELDNVFAEVGKVDKIILLGDVKHEFSENTNQEWNDVLKLFDYLLVHCKEIVVCKGNHDNYLATIAGKRGIRVVNCFVFGKYVFVHGDKEYEEMNGEEIKVWVMGHGHPAVKISDGVKTEKYKCFLTGKYKGRKIIILPSFIEYNEGTDPREYDLGMACEFDYDNFNVMVVSDELKVLKFGKLGKLD